MNRDAFLKTMKDVLKYTKPYKEKENRQDLIRLLARSKVNFVPQYEFTRNGRSGQRWEIVELRIPVPLLEEAENLENDLESLVEYVYEESDDYALGNTLIRPLVTNEDKNVIENDVVFNEIQDTLIQGIRDAKFIIWVAVAWFSNDIFLHELITKKEKGLDIRIIVSDEPSNKQMISKLQKNNFNLTVIPKWGKDGYNRMHDKFCIIDMDYVMHGSYNWTPTANHNGETLSTALDHELVLKFATEFMKLYNSNK